MSKYILLIDDDPDDADIFSDAVEDLNFDATFNHFSNGIKALESLADHSTFPPDIIFLDINMPTITGWECLRELKKIAYLQNIPIVMYTTSNLSKEVINAKDAGASAFLSKPCNFAKLKEELSSLFIKLL